MNPQCLQSRTYKHACFDKTGSKFLTNDRHIYFFSFISYNMYSRYLQVGGVWLYKVGFITDRTGEGGSTVKLSSNSRKHILLWTSNVIPKLNINLSIEFQIYFSIRIAIVTSSQQTENTWSQIMNLLHWQGYSGDEVKYSNWWMLHRLYLYVMLSTLSELNWIWPELCLTSDNVHAMYFFNVSHDPELKGKDYW